ncbi:reprolysin-like metallopeptidase [Hymenobacter nivis]|uniref:T9SS C-terminal target domain-containing protein n=1 Tax=Hymenobacter nivis TaxID=1850093 RepID=A0A502HCC4_9BACT|nr:zinc-dependent metalloprotease family protein [Hymenobacter nivis]TPG72307.1 T9SS C-terminal target domain-containing protein [Hymenobacter nivis]
MTSFFTTTGLATRARGLGALATLCFLLLATGSARAQQAWFADQPLARTAAARLPQALRQGRTLGIDLPAVRAALRPAGAVLRLPLPEGGTQRYRVRPVPVLAPALAARFPQIQTYEAQGLDDPTATARLDVGPTGFHAQVLSAGRAYYIDPAGDSAHAVAFNKGAGAPGDGWACLTGGRGPGAGLAATAGQPNGAQLRTFRLAVACTPEYSLTQGNTVARVLAAVATSINRVNGVYERELAVRLVLVANEDQVIFLSGAGAPAANPVYSNNNGTAMLGQNQTNLDRIIGTNNYDIGHVFSTGGSGIAYVGSACDPTEKAGGVSGQARPTGDGFDIDYVAHEIGHQLGATHTFNGTGGDCGGANRSPASAYEPGSGATIMAYAGICAPENVVANSLPYFHSRSYDEILAFLATQGTCATVTSTGNRPPVPVAGPGYRIPLGTPFALTGRATDPDGDALTYAWEEFDRDSVTSPIASPTGNAPLFRPFAPSLSPTRTFPQISDVVNNVQTIGELLPTYARRLHFRLVARDNRAGGGGVDYDSLSLAVVGTAGPFRVQQPNAASAQWQPGTNAAVVWDVAGTAGAPISTAQVDILLSTDGGFTYPTVLLAGAPNTGAATVAVPAGTPLTANARVMVRAVGNVFFDISDQNFSIVRVLATQPGATAAGASVFPNPSTGAATLALANAQRGPVALQLFDALGRTVWATQATKTTDTWQYPLDLGPLAAGVYALRVALPAGPLVLKVVRQ